MIVGYSEVEGNPKNIKVSCIAAYDTGESPIKDTSGRIFNFTERDIHDIYEAYHKVPFFWKNKRYPLVYENHKYGLENVIGVMTKKFEKVLLPNDEGKNVLGIVADIVIHKPEIVELLKEKIRVGVSLGLSLNRKGRFVGVTEISLTTTPALELAGTFSKLAPSYVESKEESHETEEENLAKIKEFEIDYIQEEIENLKKDINLFKNVRKLTIYKKITPNKENKIFSEALGLGNVAGKKYLDRLYQDLPTTHRGNFFTGEK